MAREGSWQLSMSAKLSRSSIWLTSWNTCSLGSKVDSCSGYRGKTCWNSEARAQTTVLRMMSWIISKRVQTSKVNWLIVSQGGKWNHRWKRSWCLGSSIVKVIRISRSLKSLTLITSFNLTLHTCQCIQWFPPRSTLPNALSSDREQMRFSAPTRTCICSSRPARLARRVMPGRTPKRVVMQIAVLDYSYYRMMMMRRMA